MEFVFHARYEYNMYSFEVLAARCCLKLDFINKVVLRLYQK